MKVFRFERPLYRRERSVFVVTLLFLLAFGTPSVGAESYRAENANLSPIEKELGIEIIALRLSAADYMLDFRYRVLNAEKALPLFERRVRPYLIHEESGSKLMVPSPPKVGPMRTSDKPKVERNYFIFFANPGKMVKRGHTATLVLGDIRIEQLVVE